MLGYNLRLAWKSLRRTPWLTAVLVLAIGLGIAVATTFTTVDYVFNRHPLPHKQDRLYSVRMDSFGKNQPWDQNDDSLPPSQLTYMDLRELMRSELPVRQTALYKSRQYVHPDRAIGRPFRVEVRMAQRDFFAMFEVPFVHGGPWSGQADRDAEAVIVLDRATNEKLFGGRDSVGERVRIGDHEYAVTGVLDDWRPTYKYYDLTQSAMAPVEPIFMPFETGIARELSTSGNRDGWKPHDGGGFQGLLASETVWLQYWVELDGRAASERYQAFVDGYTTDQKKLGRFERPLNNPVSDLAQTVAAMDAVPQQSKGLVAVAILFVTICSLNLMGLLLSKFLARAPEVGVRRALGASRGHVFLQHIVECEVVGLIGGAVGIALAVLGLSLINAHMPSSDYFQLDVTMLAVSIALSLVAGLVAGVYPAWRICALQPAVHVKAQ